MSKIMDIAVQIRGVSYKPNDLRDSLTNDSVILLRANNIDNDQVNYDDVVYVDKSKVKDSQYLQIGDILICASSGSKNLVGKAAIISENTQATFGAFCKVIRPKTISPGYLGLYFLSPNYREKISQLAEGVNINNIRNEHIDSLEVTIPDEKTQSDVVIRLNRLLSVIHLQKTQLKKLDELIKSRFVEMFGDPVINPRSININPWKDIFFTQTGKLDSNEAAVNGKYPFFTCSKEPLSINEYAYDCEALLLAGNNAAGIYDVKHYKGKFNAYQRTYILQLQNKEWEYAVFKHQLEDKLLFLQSQSKGTNTRYLTMGILNQLSFLVPPIKLQNRFADFVTQVEKQKATVQQSIDKLETLKKSLMQEYFG